MFEFITQHQSWAAVLIYWIFSAAVSSMPEPASNGNWGYLWLYRFCHTTAGNITTAFGNRIPGLKIFAVVLMSPLLFSVSACAAHYTIHPGALNKADSAAYDVLLVAETAIDQARIDYQAGQLPDGTKTALEALIHSYNVARESWVTYRGALAANVPTQTYFDRLTKNLSDLTSAIRAFREVQ